MKRIWTTLLATSVMALAGCGGDDDASAYGASSSSGALPPGESLSGGTSSSGASAPGAPGAGTTAGANVQDAVLVESEMTGTHVEPSADEVIRTVGDPKNGQCVTADAQTVTLY